MERQPEQDTAHDDESGYESVGKREMLWALDSIYSAVKDGSITTSDYQFKFTTAKYNKQAGSCNRRSRRSPSYEPEFSVQMLVAVKTAFADVENGSLKEGGYYFELSTPHFQFTSGCYPQQEKDGNTYIDGKREPVTYTTPGYFPGLDAVLEYIIMIMISLIKKLLGVEWLRPPGSNKKIPRRGNIPCIRLPIRIILVVSVLMVHTEASPIAKEEQPLTLTAGENGIIPFACRNEQQSATKYYTVKFEEKDRPFYVDGTFDLEGLMSPDQAERFRVAYFEEGSSMSVEINIAAVSVEDQGTYIVLLIIQGVTPEYHLMKRLVLILIPPGPAVCFLMPSETMMNMFEVHCHSRPGNGDSTLTCFQKGQKIPYLQNTGTTSILRSEGLVRKKKDGQIVHRRSFWLMNTDIPVSCCSHDIAEIGTITQTSCDQYRYPRIEPTNSPISPGDKIPTKMVPTTKPFFAEEGKKQPSYEATSYSRGCQNVDWPAVMLPLMAFFTYMCISNP